jgi:hypothetical protein
MSDKIVVFTTNNARILYVENTKDYEGLENVLINPDLTLVRGIPPHFWKIQNDVIVPMSSGEVSKVEKDQAKKGVDNVIELIPSKPGFFQKYKHHIIIAAILLGSLTYVIITSHA